MREEEVKKRIKEAGGSWDVFCDWMAGQTVSGYEDGTVNWYEYDVMRFIRYKCNPDNEPVGDFD